MYDTKDVNQNSYSWITWLGYKTELGKVCTKFL